MKRLHALRALFRVEWRQITRHPARSLLVVLLVAIPVAAMVGGSALFKTTERSVADRRTQALGRASVRADLVDDASLARTREILARLAPAASVTALVTGREIVAIPALRLAARLFAIDGSSLAADGIAAGMLYMHAGRAPTRADEVALSPVLLERLGRALGDTVHLASAGPRTITGLVVDPEEIDAPIVLRIADATEPTGTRSLLIDLPAGQADGLITPLRAVARRVVCAADFAAADRFGDVAMLVVGGFGFFEAALVIAAAFAVSLRRRQREIGLLAATGAAPPGLLASLLAAAATLAAIGALLGVAIGGGAAVLLHPFLDGWTRRLNGSLEWSTAHLLTALALGLASAIVAASVPAWSAARLPIRVALSGRRPVPGASNGPLAVGLVMLSVGLGLTLLGRERDEAVAGPAILAGSILAVLGLGMASPWLLGALGRIAGPLPLVWRLAVRDAGRFRTRNGPVVTAVLAGMSVSLMVAAIGSSLRGSIDAAPNAMTEDQLRIAGPDASAVAQRLMREFGRTPATPSAMADGSTWCVALDAPITHRTLERARVIAAESPGTTIDARLLHRQTERVFLDVVLWLCIVTGLTIILIATALSSIESASDAQVLHRVGASPAVMRSHLAARAGYLAGLGCLLAVPAGLIPASGVLSLASLPAALVIPWRQVAITVIVLPILAWGVTWLTALLRTAHAERRDRTARRRPPIHPFS